MSPTETERKIAFFLDFDNIALGVRDAKYEKFEISLILERLLEKGKVLVKRAYADWSHYQEYRRAFHEAALEMMEIPARRYSGKNSADIRMVVDAMDLCYSKDHVDTFAIASGDSDFSPLVSKLRENGKYVMGLGVKNSTSDLLVENCDEFVFYEDLVREKKAAGGRFQDLPKKKAQAFSLVLAGIRALRRDGRETLWASMLKETIKRKKPSFDEGYYGYGSFSRLLEDMRDMELVELEKDRRSGSYIITDYSAMS
ncbi:MAG: NYN domain-containing protein [Planctomycetota bacterium]